MSLSHSEVLERAASCSLLARVNFFNIPSLFKPHFHPQGQTRPFRPRHEWRQCKGLVMFRLWVDCITGALTGGSPCAQKGAGMATMDLCMGDRETRVRKDYSSFSPSHTCAKANCNLALSVLGPKSVSIERHAGKREEFCQPCTQRYFASTGKDHSGACTEPYPLAFLQRSHLPSCLIPAAGIRWERS